jgi:hypothetical protein
MKKPPPRPPRPPLRAAALLLLLGPPCVSPAAAPPTHAENQNENHTLLTTRVPLAGATAPVRIAVAITAAENAGAPVEIVPPAGWENTGG